MRDKIVLMTGGTETLDYFSRELAKGFCLLGYKIFLFDLACEEESSEALAHFAGFSDTILVTFNFDGIHMETSLYDGAGNLFWETRDIPCVNIAVDHPFFFPELLAIHPENFYQVSIDRMHQNYIQKFHPDVARNFFLPLGGTTLFPNGGYAPVAQRRYDVVFTGNYTPKEEFDVHINRLGEEYALFYRRILKELIEFPDRPDDIVMEQYLKKEFPDATREELRETMSNMIFIDTYIRGYYRGRVVQTLLDGGISVHCIGKGWSRLECARPELLTWEEDLLSHDCLEKMAEAKISLNVMPWFKDGAHDRVFNAMANGSVCLTDHSRYLDETLEDGKDAVFYDLKDLERLPGQVTELLNNPEKMQTIADAGYAKALKEHTWLKRAEQLHRGLLSKL